MWLYYRCPSVMTLRSYNRNVPYQVRSLNGIRQRGQIEDTNCAMRGDDALYVEPSLSDSYITFPTG